MARGRRDPQVSMLAFIDLNERIPADHPLCAIKRMANTALIELSPLFDAMYALDGRPSIPPERLLKASLRIARSSERRERAFCEELDYHLANLVMTWGLSRKFDEAGQRWEDPPAITPTCCRSRLPFTKSDTAGEFGIGRAEGADRVSAKLERSPAQPTPTPAAASRPHAREFASSISFDD